MNLLRIAATPSNPKVAVWFVGVVGLVGVVREIAGECRVYDQLDGYCLMDKRGIIISPTLKTPGQELIDPIYLRQCLLYWDMIDCPNDHIIKVTLNRNLNDIELLQKEGILIRTEGFFFAKKSPHYKNILSVHHDHPIEFWALAQLYAFKKHNETGSTFVIGQFNNNVIFSEFDPDEAFFFVESPPWDKKLNSNVLGLRQESFFSTKNELERGPIIDLQLYQAIPVPIEKVPIENILKFKDIRKDELLRFRHAMDAFYLSIINSNDIPRAKTHAIDEIDLSLCEINRVMKESGWKRILSNIDVSMKIPQPSELINNITIAGAGGAYVGSKIGIPHTCAVIGMAAGAITSFIKVDVKEAFKPRRIPDNLMDFAYLYYAKEELGK